MKWGFIYGTIGNEDFCWESRSFARNDEEHNKPSTRAGKPISKACHAEKMVCLERKRLSDLGKFPPIGEDIGT